MAMFQELTYLPTLIYIISSLIYNYLKFWRVLFCKHVLSSTYYIISYHIISSATSNFVLFPFISECIMHFLPCGFVICCKNGARILCSGRLYFMILSYIFFYSTLDNDPWCDVILAWDDNVTLSMIFLGFFGSPSLLLMFEVESVCRFNRYQRWFA